MEPENTMLSLRRNIAGKRFTEADKQDQYRRNCTDKKKYR